MNDLILSDKYLQYLAGLVTDDRNLHDDLVQEGRIHVWKLMERNEQRPKQYYVVAAKRRMRDICSGNGMPVGHIPHRGWVDVMHPRRPPVDSYEKIVSDAYEWDV